MQFVCTILSKAKVLVMLPVLRNKISFVQMRRLFFPLNAVFGGERKSRDNYLWDSMRCLCCL